MGTDGLRDECARRGEPAQEVIEIGGAAPPRPRRSRRASPASQAVGIRSTMSSSTGRVSRAVRRRVDLGDAARPGQQHMVADQRKRIQRRRRIAEPGVVEVERRAVVDEPELAMPDQHVGVARGPVEVGHEGVEPDDARGELGIGRVGERVEGEGAREVVEAEVECRRWRGSGPGSRGRARCGPGRRRARRRRSREPAGRAARAISPATSSAISALRALAGAAELEDVQAVVVGLDHGRKRPALAQRRDVAGGGDGSHSRADSRIGSA